MVAVVEVAVVHFGQAVSCTKNVPAFAFTNDGHFLPAFGMETPFLVLLWLVWGTVGVCVAPTMVCALGALWGCVCVGEWQRWWGRCLIGFGRLDGVW